MNRITTTLITLTAPALLCQAIHATDADLENLQSRLLTIESRLSAMEKTLMKDTGSFSYQEKATLEATNGGSSAATGEGESKTYLIKDGDTLGSIARQHGVERADLLAANRLSEGQPIYIGETLLIPGGAPVSSASSEQKLADTTPPAGTTSPADATEKSVIVGETKPEPTRADGQARSHVVAKGDTLTSISRKYGTDVPTLKSANGLKNDVISLGQKLSIPAAGVTVASDTSGSGPAPSQEAAFEYDNPLLRNDETYGYYTVQKGDNLYALARDFFTSMAELQRLNKLDDSMVIYPGNDLIVPTGKYNAHHNTGDVAQR